MDYGACLESKSPERGTGVRIPSLPPIVRERGREANGADLENQRASEHAHVGSNPTAPAILIGV